MSNKTLFHTLLVLTMVWAGLSCFSYLMMALLMPTMQELYSQNPTLVPDQFAVMMDRMFEVPRSFYAASGVLYVLEVVGAAVMWRLRWTGFHCYTLARLLLLLLPALFLGRGFVGVGDIMFALLFIAVYYLLLRRLIAEQQEPPADPQPPAEV